MTNSTINSINIQVETLPNSSQTNRTNSPIITRNTTITSSTSTTTMSYISLSTSTSSSPNITAIDGTIDSITPYEICYSSPEDYELIQSVICSTLIVLGVVYLIYGYRCFKAIMFLTGFAFATTVIYIICLAENLLPMYGNVMVSLVAGFLFGLITMLVAYVGLFMLGFHLGLLCSCATLIVIYLITPYVDAVEPPNSAWIIFAIFMALGLVGSCATLYFQKGCTIIATVFYGSATTLSCFDYFIENFKLLYWFRDKLRDGQDLYDSIGTTRTTNLCLISWIILSLWPSTVIIGLLIQWCVTAKGVNYENDYNYGVVSTTASRNAGQLNLSRLRNEDNKLEQRQRKYRYLYQVRTAHGDVISQHYIQSLHKKKVCPPDDSLTYNSDLSSHLTIIPSDSRTTTMSVA